MERFKTGTPPRINSNTIDYSKTEIQPGDDEPLPLALKQRNSLQINCLAGSPIQMNERIKSSMKICIVHRCFRV